MPGTGVGFLGTGSYLPERVLTNADIEKMVNTSDEWILTRTGIRERRMAAPGQAASDLAAEACRRALENARTSPSEIDLLVVATITPDCLFPSTACVLQDKLGLRNIGAMDVLAACSGFVYALSIGTNAIRSGTARRVLVAGTEVLSSIINWQDRNTCVLFGDGAGAAVLGPAQDGEEILHLKLGSDGAKGDYAILPAGGSRVPCSQKSLAENLHFISLRGRELFKVATVKLCEVVQEALCACDLKLSDLSWIIPHQMNVRIMEAVAKRLNLPMDRMIVNIDRCGNTSAASIPIAFDEARREGKFKKGQHVCFVALGGGLTWGAAVVKW